MNPQPTVPIVIQQLLPQVVPAHWLTPHDPYLLLIYVLAAHDIELDYEKMAQLSRQQLDARLWMTGPDHVKAALATYVDFGQQLRRVLDSNIYVNPYEYLQRHGHDISHLPTPPPTTGPPGYVHLHGNYGGTGRSFWRGGRGGIARGGREGLMGANYGASWAANIPRAPGTHWRDTEKFNSIDHWRQFVIPGSEQNLAIQTPMGIENETVELPNDPLGIVESIERYDDYDVQLPRGRELIITSEDSRRQFRSRSRDYRYLDPTDLSMRLWGLSL